MRSQWCNQAPQRETLIHRSLFLYHIYLGKSMIYLIYLTRLALVGYTKNRIGGNACHYRNGFLQVHAGGLWPFFAERAALWMNWPRHLISLTTPFVHTLPRSSGMELSDSGERGVAVANPPTSTIWLRKQSNFSQKHTVRCLSSSWRYSASTCPPMQWRPYCVRWAVASLVDGMLRLGIFPCGLRRLSRYSMNLEVWQRLKSAMVTLVSVAIAAHLRPWCLVIQKPVTLVKPSLRS